VLGALSQSGGNTPASKHLMFMWRLLDLDGQGSLSRVCGPICEAPIPSPLAAAATAAVIFCAHSAARFVLHDPKHLK
jgi:hypothetical protein